MYPNQMVLHHPIVKPEIQQQEYRKSQRKLALSALRLRGIDFTQISVNAGFHKLGALHARKRQMKRDA